MVSAGDKATLTSVARVVNMKNNLYERLHNCFYNHGTKAGSPGKIGDLIPNLSGSNKENSQY